MPGTELGLGKEMRKEMQTFKDLIVPGIATKSIAQCELAIFIAGQH